MKKLALFIAIILIITSSAITAFAEPMVEMPVAPSVSTAKNKIETIYFKVVDKNNNPVENIEAYGIYSDKDGLLVAQYIEVLPENKTNIHLNNNYSGDSKTYTTSISIDKNTPVKLIWDLPTPQESISEIKNKVLFRVLDKEGNPLEDAEFVGFTPKQTQEQIDKGQKPLPIHCPMIKTDEKGETYYTHSPIKDYIVTLNYKDSYKNFKLTITQEHLEKNYIFTFRL